MALPGPALLSWLACAGPEGDRVPTGLAPPPALRDEGTLRLLALGDAGKGNAGQRRVAGGAAKVCAEAGCDLVVLLGDNVYPKGMESAKDQRIEELVGRMYADAAAPLYLVLGNHDYGTGRDRQRARWQVEWANQRDGVELPANAWFTDAGPARLIGLDTNAVFHFGKDFQQRWLREQLSSSDAPWQVVLGHHPFRSDGPHGNAGAYEGTSLLPVISGASLRELFESELCAGADLYLAGHDHSRQLLSYCGVTLLVSGAGASATEIVDRGNDPRFAKASLGMVWVELGAKQGTIRFADADGNWDSEPFTIWPR